MRNFYTSVVELRQPFTGTVTTTPYETGWASEAIFFVTVENTAAGFEQLSLRVQCAADGVHWVSEGTVMAPITGAGENMVKVSHFGGWLRLAGELTGTATLTVRLALKE